MTTEEYIKDFTRGCSNEMGAVEYSDGRKETEYHEWLTPDNARAIAQIAKKEIIDKVCAWLKIHTFIFDDVEQIDLFLELFERNLRKED